MNRGCRRVPVDLFAVERGALETIYFSFVSCVRVFFLFVYRVVLTS